MFAEHIIHIISNDTNCIEPVHRPEHPDRPGGSMIEAKAIYKKGEKHGVHEQRDRVPRKKKTCKS